MDAGHGPPNEQGGQQAEVVGYVLGRMEDKAFLGIRDPAMNNPPETGHVTSLAVLPAYRRCGVAQRLMTNLHQQVRHHKTFPSSNY